MMFQLFHGFIDLYIVDSAVKLRIECIWHKNREKKKHFKQRLGGTVKANVSLYPVAVARVFFLPTTHI